MKEVISLYIGQAGVQLGNSLWELLCAEHGINEQGCLQEQPLNNECLETFFCLTPAGRYVPRGLFVDLEPSVIDEIRNGSFKNLFHPNRLITGPEDAAGNFARGFFTVGKLLLGTINAESRRLLENSNCIQGIFIFRSLGGGTGAGLTSAIFDGLAEFPKIPKIEIPIYPSPTLSSAMVEPYNCLLGEHFCMEDVDVGMLVDNEALYDICSKYLTLNYPTFSTINRMVAQLCSSITASVRFESIMNCDITVLQTNLVPYPRIHFPLANFAPILSPDKGEHEDLSVMEITRYVFERDNQMMKVDHSFGRFMSCSLLYRGNISPYHVYMALAEIKKDKSIEFVDWCPTGFKVGINVSPPTIIPASHLAQTNKNVTMLTNSSAIGQAWQRITHKFYLLYSKRSFVHWFVGEGMEECEFTESLYNISALVKDYEEAALDTKYEGEGAADSSPPSAPATNGTMNRDNASAQDQREDEGLSNQNIHKEESPLKSHGTSGTDGEDGFGEKEEMKEDAESETETNEDKMTTEGTEESGKESGKEEEEEEEDNANENQHFVNKNDNEEFESDNEKDEVVDFNDLGNEDSNISPKLFSRSSQPDL